MNNKQYNKYLNHYFNSIGKFHKVFNCNHINYLKNMAYKDFKLNNISFKDLNNIFDLIQFNTINKGVLNE